MWIKMYRDTDCTVEIQLYECKILNILLHSMWTKKKLYLCTEHLGKTYSTKSQQL